MPRKKVDPAVSEHFRKLQKKSWAVRLKKILDKKKVEQTKQ